MFVPRLHFSNSAASSDIIIEQIKQACEKEVKCIYLRTNHLSELGKTKVAQEVKKITLLTMTVLLIDDLKIAALVNADGAILPYGDYNHGRAKDILGEEKLVGAVAHRIDDIAEYWEEGMADFINLESYQESDQSNNILGKQKTQTIIDDAKIMGYNLPIIISGGIEIKDAEDVLEMGCYGLLVDQSEHIQKILDLIRLSPLR